MISIFNLFRKSKKDVIHKNRIHKKDIGSRQVQIGLLNRKVDNVIEHLKNYPNDEDSRYSLVKLVHKRRKLKDGIQ